MNMERERIELFDYFKRFGDNVMSDRLLENLIDDYFVVLEKIAEEDDVSVEEVYHAEVYDSFLNISNRYCKEDDTVDPVVVLALKLIEDSYCDDLHEAFKVIDDEGWYFGREQYIEDFVARLCADWYSDQVTVPEWFRPYVKVDWAAMGESLLQEEAWVQHKDYCFVILDL